jgi:hypothetical protein
VGGKTVSRFQKAIKAKCKARVALYGPSGSGKTFTALRMATGMGGAIALIDTEYGSASKYADRFEFDTLTLEHATIDNLCQAITDAHGYGVLVIDSMSHAWQELIQEVEQLAKRKYRGNTFSAWAEGTPKQKRLVRALLSFPGHVIATMRVKTEWVEQEDRGKTKYVRQGLNPEQGKGIEYEFDLLVSMSVDHVGTVEKDRSGKYQDQIIEKPGEAFGKALADWLNDGVAVASTIAAQTGMTTADQLPAKPSIHANGLDALKRMKELKQAALLIEWTHGEFGKHLLTATERLDLDTRLAAKLPELCKEPADFETADKLIYDLMVAGRLSDPAGTELRVKLADVKDSKLGAPA